MKKLLYIFILLPLIVKAQTVSDWDSSLYDWDEDAQSYTYPIITDNNMSAIFLPWFHIRFCWWSIDGIQRWCTCFCSLHNL